MRKLKSNRRQDFHEENMLDTSTSNITTWFQKQILKKRYQKKKQDQSDKTKPFGGHCGNLEKWLSLKSKLQE